MKKYLLILTFVLVALFGVNSGVSADQLPNSDPTDYKLLAPIPGLVKPGTKDMTDIGTYLPNLIKLIIALASAFAVIMIIIGGIQYMSTDAVSGKSSGRETIQNALMGLLLAISAYTILYTVNPRLLNLSLSLDRVGTTTPSSFTVSSGTPIDTGQEAPDGPVDFGPSSNTDWPSDSRERGEFIKAGISINKQNCQKVGAPSCTSLVGISQNVLVGLQKLKTACKCLIVVTGGTEYWLHGNRSTELGSNKTPHRPSGVVADLSLNTPTTDFLRTDPNSKKTTTSTCAPGNEKYLFAGGLYVNEIIAGNPPHWHVCFY